MEIIRADMEHLEAIAVLFDQYRQFYEEQADLAACKQFIEKRLSNNESVIFVAQSATDDLLGFTQLYRSFCSVEMAELIYLYDLFVTPAARRQGVARSLMQAAREYASNRGAGRLQLETAVTNHPGQALYEQLGWQRDEDFFTYHLSLND